MPDIAEFVPEHATRQEWDRYHAYRRIHRQEWRPEEPLTPDDVLEAQMRRPNPRERQHRYHVTIDGEVVADVGTSTTRPESPEYETNKHLLWAGGYVLRAHRRQGIARSWLPIVIGLMEEQGSTVLSAGAEDEPGHAFLRRLGAEPKLTERESRLDLRLVDWDMTARWIREAEAASADARLDLYPRWVPDEMLDVYCASLNELLNTMPFEGLDHGDIVMTPDSIRDWRGRLEITGSTNPTCIVRDADGVIVGVTDVLNHPHEQGLVRQLFTGVHPRARGRGLGKWIKAVMAEHVRDVYPDTIWISTENAGSNAPMLSINHALGFRLHRTVTYYQVGLEALRRAV